MDFSLITYHFLLPMLHFFKELVGSYGWAIIIVTILVKLALYPLTRQQTLSMKKMQALQPKIKILQERLQKQKAKYKDRPAKLKEVQAEFQKEMMEFYQTNKVNPLGGCFPMLIQLPVLIALFWAFNGSPFKPVAITAPIEVLSQENSLKEQKNGSSKPQIFINQNGDKSRFVLNPGQVKIPEGSEINYMVYKLEGNVNGISNQVKWELSDQPYYTPSMKSSVSNVAEIKAVSGGVAVIKAKNTGRIFLQAILPATSEDEKFLFISGLGKTGPVDHKTGRLNIDIIILVFLFGLTIWLSGKVTQQSAPPSADPKQAQMQKMMQRFMPPMVTMMMLFFPVPAGVLLYFVASGFIQALQTWVVMKSA